MAHEPIITVTGNLGTDAEFRKTPNGTPVTSFSIANTSRKQKMGEWVDGDTTWFRIFVWETDAAGTARTYIVQPGVAGLPTSASWSEVLAAFKTAIETHGVVHVDADDTIQGMYATAIQADIDENTVSGSYAAMRAQEALNGPDPFAREWVRDFPLSDDVCRCMCLGLVPTGAWSALAAQELHSPRQPPEIRGMLRALDDPSPWMATLGGAVHTLSVLSGIARGLGMDYNVAVILTNLLAFLYRISDGPAAPEWQGTLGA
jgi:hypothetical protein